MGIEVSKPVDKVPDFKRVQYLLMKSAVMVGIPESTAERDDTGEKYEISNAQLGYIHENGVPEKNIPARPFLIPGVESIQKQTIMRFQRAANEALEGDASAVETTLNRIGLAAEKAVVEEIDRQQFEPLSPKTLAARVERGHTGTQILIETGKLRGSVTYVIRDE